MPADRAFVARVLEVVRAIPEGRVMTYGQVALLAGAPQRPRQVGAILRGLGSRGETDVPWQRVINGQGELSTWRIGLGEVQRAFLEAEGVTFSPEGRVDLHRFQHWPGE
ncbi:methylated-DNA-protein-cysteine methyltransferase-like protein [Deinobacterium chartae]|uniref:Methylated-DNA-protein-cysteine methyltransferase-like protein n=1 Tax=Deinobacterium chartae TaxID=521158 RepID=A0A841I1K6_9DEIO|nr:methylated-DNA-protein-cysteine methyltransferase-like protein [Deinobacterium chartae]